MKLSIDTEIEEIAELRHSIAIIEDAIKRRENPEEATETQTTVETATESQPAEQEEPTQEPQEEPTEPQQEPPPEVDLSKLATSDYGERIENRSMVGEAPTTEITPVEPQQDNKTLVKDIIQTLKEKSGGEPIQMQDIISLAQEKNISEEETRSLVNELQSSSSI